MNKYKEMKNEMKQKETVKDEELRNQQISKENENRSFGPIARLKTKFYLDIASIYFIVGIGIGIMLKHKTSTGGADLLALLLSNILHVNVGVLIFFIDSIVIAMGGFLISPETFYLSIITITFVGISTYLITRNRVSDCSV